MAALTYGLIPLQPASAASYGCQSRTLQGRSVRQCQRRHSQAFSVAVGARRDHVEQFITMAAAQNGSGVDGPGRNLALSSHRALHDTAEISLRH